MSELKNKIVEDKTHYPITDIKTGKQSKCKKCGNPLKFYDGVLGYEAVYCDKCGYYADTESEGYDESFINR